MAVQVMGVYSLSCTSLYVIQMLNKQMIHAECRTICASNIFQMEKRIAFAKKKVSEREKRCNCFDWGESKCNMEPKRRIDIESWVRCVGQIPIKFNGLSTKKHDA